MTHQQGTLYGYSIEGRSTHGPRVIGGQIFVGEWQTVAYDRDRDGVPVGPDYQAQWLNCHSLYSYESAEALRWGLIAELARDMKDLCFETRILKHKITFETSATEGEEVVGSALGFEDRRHK